MAWRAILQGDGFTGTETSKHRHGCPRPILVHNTYFIGETLLPSLTRASIRGRLRLHETAALQLRSIVFSFFTACSFKHFKTSLIPIYN